MNKASLDLTLLVIEFTQKELKKVREETVETKASIIASYSELTSTNNWNCCTLLWQNSSKVYNRRRYVNSAETHLTTKKTESIPGLITTASFQDPYVKDPSRFENRLCTLLHLMAIVKWIFYQITHARQKII